MPTPGSPIRAPARPRPRAAARRAIACAITAAVLGAGCTDGGDSPPTTTTTEPAGALPDARPEVTAPPSPAPGPSTAPTPDAPPTTTPVPVERCGATEADAIAAAVRGQLDAIVTRDWADALAFATPSFRSQFDPASFADVIVAQFPVVAAATGADLGTCTVDGGRVTATVVVAVADGDGNEQDLLYLLELHDGTWLIGGALPAQTSGDSDGSMEV